MTATRLSSVRLRLAAALAVQAVLVAGAVAPQLSARLTGDEILLAVAPLDPVDPFRGAYVTLDYPGLPRATERPHPRGTVFVPLRQSQDGLWTGEDVVRAQPEDGRYLRCSSDGFSLHCGIDSLFASQAEARRLEEQLAQGGAVAQVRLDDRGNAAVVAVRPG